MVTTRVIVIVSVKMGLVTVRVLNRISSLLRTTTVITRFRADLGLYMFTFTRFVRLQYRVVRLIRVFVFARLAMGAIRVTIVIHSRPFLMKLTRIVLLTSPSPLRRFLRFFNNNKGLRPLTRGLTLVMLPGVNSGNNGKVVLIIVMV